MFNRWLSVLDTIAASLKFFAAAARARVIASDLSLFVRAIHQHRLYYIHNLFSRFLGGRALTLALPLFYSFRNSFHSAMPWALRRSAVTGSSFGARGSWSSFKPASCGRRLPLRVLTCLLDHTRFSHVSGPPRERGTTWSRLPSSGRSNAPVYWQRLPSRSRMARAQSFGRFLGTRA